jgi:hypothetical protein
LCLRAVRRFAAVFAGVRGEHRVSGQTVLSREARRLCLYWQWWSGSAIGREFCLDLDHRIRLVPALRTLRRGIRLDLFSNGGGWGFTGVVSRASRRLNGNFVQYFEVGR